MDLQLNDKSVVVTGGSRGIGLAIADAFAAEGAKVALCATRRGRLRGGGDNPSSPRRRGVHPAL